MKKEACVLGVVLVVVLLAAGCTEQGPKRLYTNALYGFSLDPPVGWVGAENASSDVAVRFYPANTTNVSVTVGVPFSLSEGLALSVFADLVEENLSESGLNYTVVYRDSRALAGGLTAYEIAYSYEEGGVVQRVKQVAVLRSRTVFMVTFSAPAALYIVYLSVVDRCLDSLV